MYLRDYVAAYALANDIEPATVQYLSDAVRALDHWRGVGEQGPLPPVNVEDLCDDLLNRWINARLANGKSRKTVKTQRGAIITLWRAAHDDGLVPAEPRKVKTVRIATDNPNAWWPAETARLLSAAAEAPGYFPCGARRADLLTCLVLVGYYSLLRPCDLRKLRKEDIRSDGGLTWRQAKTKWTVDRCLPADALEALAKLFQQTDTSAVFPVSKKTIQRWWNWLKCRAEIPGSLKWLRRTGATACEIQQPGSAMQALGHKTPGLAYAHYVDRRQLQVKPPTPPTITPAPPGA